LHHTTVGKVVGMAEDLGSFVADLLVENFTAAQSTLFM